MAKESIEQALAEVTDWMEVKGVEGIGQGRIDDKDCILVFVSMKTPEIRKAIPPEYAGYPVRIEEVGNIVIQKGKTNPSSPRS